jgi:signal transduction histidine kinase
MLRREQNNKLMNLAAIVASISHEIRQPLGAIELDSSSAHLLLGKAVPDLEGVRTILDEVSASGRRIDKTLSGFRTLFGKVDPRREPVDINAVVLEALRSSRAELQDHGVTAQTKLASVLPPLHGDRNQLYQVIFNLVHNAIEAMSGTTDRSKLLAVRTRISDYNATVVEVSDTGPGIDPARTAEIFDAFVTTKPHGMGLGLAICRMIVERHGGRLSVSSADSRGAVFQIIFPHTDLPR